MAATALVRDLREAVGPAGVVVDRDVLAGHEVDWTGRFRGSASALVRPATTAEVAAVLAVVREHGAALVPQGGNTGLVGGSVPRADLGRPQVVLSTRRLDHVGEVDPTSGQLELGAGVALVAAQATATATGRELGIDLAARDTATVGGVVATNAGGLHVVGSGTTRQRLRGIEAVTGRGEVVTHLRGLVKDNTGYDLPGLLCGSEGTLAVVTRVRLATSPRPAGIAVAVLALAGADDAVRAAAALRDLPGIRAVEVMRRDGVALVRDVAGLPAPPAWDDGATHWLTVEVGLRGDPAGSRTDDTAGGEQAALLLAEATTGLGVLDAAVAQDGDGRRRLWAWRERHTEAVQHHGVPAKLDVAVPPGAIAAFEQALAERVAPLLPHGLVTFGHLAEGNEHVQLLGVGDEPGVAGPAETAVLAIVEELGGTISAEHGIGVAKRDALGSDRSAGDLATMRAIRAALDPDEVMNPGVLFPT